MSELRRITEHYHLDKLVRTSPSGSVFRATDLRTNATVAVKLVVGEDAAGDPEEQRERFLQTARALQAVRHPAVPAVLDFGFTTAGSAFLVTEYLHGSSLEVFVGERPARVLPLLILVVSGLEALEEQGLAHLNLGIEHVIVTPGPQGEQIKLLGLGGSALRSPEGAAAGPQARKTDLRELAHLACRLLGLPDQAAAPIEIPAKIAREIDRPDRLRSLLTGLLQPDAPEPPPSYEEVGHALRVSLAGEAEWKTEVFVDPSLSAPSLSPVAQDADRTAVLPRVKKPPSPAPSAPPLPPLPAPMMPPVPAPAMSAPMAQTQTMAMPMRLPRWLLPAAGAAMVALLIAAFVLFSGKDEAPEPSVAAPEPVVTRAVAPEPPPPTPVSRVHPLIERAEASLAAGDPEGARAVLAAIPSQERAALSVAELDRLRKVESVLPPPRREELTKELSAALRVGDLRRLSAAVAAFRPEDRQGLAAGARKDLDRAVQIVGAEGRLMAAEKGGRPLEVIRLAGELLALAPSASRARTARESAAAALEAEAERAVAAGQLDAALASLESLRGAWAERPGVDARIDRIRAERRATEGLEASLVAAEHEGRANRPHEGLRLLAGSEPSPRFEERFRKVRSALEAQLGRLDQAPPVVTIRGNLPEVEKGKSVRIPIRITDDYEVLTAELWARTEGGQFQKVPLRHISGADYEAEIAPGFHQNKAMEFYLLASDRSGHQGSLGSLSTPQKLRRKGFLKRMLDRGDE